MGSNNSVASACFASFAWSANSTYEFDCFKESYMHYIIKTVKLHNVKYRSHFEEQVFIA